MPLVGNSVAFSADGEKLAVAGHQKATIWDLVTRSDPKVLTGHTDSVSCIAFSPDGDQVATCSFDGTVKLWDASSGELLITLYGHFGSVKSVAYSPDGSRLVSGSDDGTIKFWDTTFEGELNRIAGFPKSVSCMGMSSDGSWLATYRDNAISLWDMKKKAKLKTYCNQDLGNIRSIAISNDGAYVAVPSEGWRKFPRGGVVLMNTETGWEAKMITRDPDRSIWPEEGSTRIFNLQMIANS